MRYPNKQSRHPQRQAADAEYAARLSESRARYRGADDRLYGDAPLAIERRPADDQAHSPSMRHGDYQPLRAPWDPLSTPNRRDKRERPPRRTRSAFGSFITNYGWRAYVIPVLVVLTVALIVVTARGAFSSDSPAADSAPESRDPAVTAAKTPIGAPKGVAEPSSLPSGALPDGGPFTNAGAKSWHVVPGRTATVGSPTASKTYSYTIEIENGLASSDFGGDKAFGALVDATLANPRSWIGGGQVSFRRITDGTPDFRVSLTSPATTRDLCGYQIKLESSCFDPPEARVVINEARWVRGAVAYQGDDLLYRQYAANHEIGHAIGYAQHEPCQTGGELAPVMMQQSFGVANRDIMALDPDMKANRELTCRANPWPFPAK